MWQKPASSSRPLVTTEQRSLYRSFILFGLPCCRTVTLQWLRLPRLICIAERVTTLPSVRKGGDAASAARYRAALSIGRFDVYLKPLRTPVIASQIAFQSPQPVVPFCLVTTPLRAHWFPLREWQGST